MNTVHIKTFIHKVVDEIKVPKLRIIKGKERFLNTCIALIVTRVKGNRKAIIVNLTCINEIGVDLCEVCIGALLDGRFGVFFGVLAIVTV
jgi:hypothetical protein